MKVVGLISGGKDSCYNLIQCVSEGHEIVALANLCPEDKDELDSFMYQTVGHRCIELFGEAMGLPLFRQAIRGTSKDTSRDYQPEEGDEVEDLFHLLRALKAEIDVDAVSIGGIFSDYQRVRVENVCGRLDLTVLAYLWRRNQQELLQEIINSGVSAIIIKVAAIGLEPNKHLGQSLTEIFPHMIKMNEKYGLNICGEGGEYETFTLDCPLFKKRIVIDDSETVIHCDDAFAPVGYIRFKKVHLEDKTNDLDRCPFEHVCCLPVMKSSSLLADLFPDQQALHIDGHCTAPAQPLSLPACHEPSVKLKMSEHMFWIVGLSGFGSNITEATKQVMEKLIKSLCKTKETTEVKNLSVIHLYVQKMADYPEVNAVYKAYFGLNPPVRICVQVCLPQNMHILMDCYGCYDSLHCSKQTMHVQSISHWAPANIGPYSQAVKLNNLIYVAGQIGLSPATMRLAAGGISVEARLSLRHIQRILEAVHTGCTLWNVVLCVCYVTQPEYIRPAKSEWQLALSSQSADVTHLEHCHMTEYAVVSALPRGALVEWHVVAFASDDEIIEDQECHRLGNSTVHFQYAVSIKAKMFAFRGTLCCKYMLTPGNTVEEFISLYNKLLDRLSYSWIDVPLMRVFYVARYFEYNELNTAICTCLQSFHTPAYTLLPVYGLGDDFCVLSICH